MRPSVALWRGLVVFVLVAVSHLALLAPPAAAGECWKLEIYQPSYTWVEVCPPI